MGLAEDTEGLFKDWEILTYQRQEERPTERESMWKQAKSAEKWCCQTSEVAEGNPTHSAGRGALGSEGWSLPLREENGRQGPEGTQTKVKAVRRMNLNRSASREKGGKPLFSSSHSNITPGTQQTPKKYLRNERAGESGLARQQENARPAVLAHETAKRTPEHTPAIHLSLGFWWALF